MPKKKRSQAQIEAERRYNRSRLKQPCIPAIRLDQQQEEFTDRVFEKHGGTKKDAVLEGLKLLDEKIG